MRNIADAIEQFIISELFANEQTGRTSSQGESCPVRPARSLSYTLTLALPQNGAMRWSPNGETGASSGSSACLGRQPSNPSCQRAKETCLPISWSRLWPPTN